MEFKRELEIAWCDGIDSQSQLASANLLICLKNSSFGVEKFSFSLGLSLILAIKKASYLSETSSSVVFLGMYCLMSLFAFSIAPSRPREMQDAFITIISKFDEIVEILFPPLAIPTFIAFIGFCIAYPISFNVLLLRCSSYPAWSSQRDSSPWGSPPQGSLWQRVRLW